MRVREPERSATVSSRACARTRAHSDREWACMCGEGSPFIATPRDTAAPRLHHSRVLSCTRHFHFCHGVIHCTADGRWRPPLRAWAWDVASGRGPVLQINSFFFNKQWFCRLFLTCVGVFVFQMLDMVSVQDSLWEISRGIPVALTKHAPRWEHVVNIFLGGRNGGVGFLFLPG